MNGEVNDSKMKGDFEVPKYFSYHMSNTQNLRERGHLEHHRNVALSLVSLRCMSKVLLNFLSVFTIMGTRSKIIQRDSKDVCW